MKKIAVILSGCGVFDGSEIHEAVLTLLCIDRAGAQYQCFASDINQYHVINHISGNESNETRNMLTESARIARGEINNLNTLDAKDFDAVIVPGGFGAAKNFCDFAFKGREMEILPEFKNAIGKFIMAKKPVGLICIAPAMAGKLFGPGIKCTIGHNEETASTIEQTGAQHIACDVEDIVIDEEAKLVTTPAYMIARSISEVEKGISKLVNAILGMI